MTSHERFAAAMAHQQPDRIPLDIGATSLTGIRPACQERLRKLLGLSEAPAPNPNGVDEAILEWAGTDFRAVGGIIPLPGSLTKQLSESAFMDCWGIRRDIIGGEYQITNCPLRNATRADLDAFPWPEPHIDDPILELLRSRAATLHKTERHVVIAEHPVFGILELGCWMCGYDDFMIKMALEPDFVRAFFDRVLSIQLAVLEAYYPVLGPYVALTTSGDDFGSQQGPLVSPDMFSELIAPYFKERITRTKALANCYYWHHSCGSITDLLDTIIDCGVDILNPIQTSARDMEPASLKARFGDRLVFWGAVDVQQFLPYATREEIPVVIQNLCHELGRDGGYVMAPAHEIQDDVPAENIVAWVESLRTS